LDAIASNHLPNLDDPLTDHLHQIRLRVRAGVPGQGRLEGRPTDAVGVIIADFDKGSRRQPGCADQDTRGHRYSIHRQQFNGHERHQKSDEEP
jgi:hypothetical protein